MEQQKPEYLEKFKEAAGSFQLFGNKILIERMELGEVRTAGGLIVADTSSVRSDLRMQKPHLGVVLAVGPGYYDADENKYQPLDVQPGNIVIISSVGVQYYSLLPGSSSYNSNKVGITTESDVQMRFADLEAFNNYSKIMSANHG